MAQTGSAQREPSMEEILASIRRIIEDSDTVRSPAEADAPSQAEAAALPEVEAFRAELEEPAAVSMAEIKASVSRAQAEEEPAPWTAEVRPLRGEARQAEAAEPAGPAADAPHEEPAAAVSGKADAVEENAPAEARPAIISDQTGRQVAAAFGELSEAFAASRRRSFDEMAEEMLRPMLQDWLDNNLPTLVEKLVREEIERVARGG